MRKNAALPVRLDADVGRRLDAAAKRLGMTRSALIRMLVESFVDQLDANDGRVVLPLRWTTEEPASTRIRLAPTGKRNAGKA